MIRIRVSVDAQGCLTALDVAGHALESGAPGENVVCAAVTGLVRACAQALVAREGLEVDGRAHRPGELGVRVVAVPDATREWLRGVTDVALAGLRRMALESPADVELEVERGEVHGT